MSLYNMIHGVNPIAIMAIPMLGDTHPDDYPRFRNVFLADEEHPEYDGYIHVYTRVGGNNRGAGYGEEELERHQDYVCSFDDSFDDTYATYVFNVPDRWAGDFSLVLAGEPENTSAEYQSQVEKVFPKLIGKFPWDRNAEEAEDKS